MSTFGEQSVHSWLRINIYSSYIGYDKKNMSIDHKTLDTKICGPFFNMDKISGMDK